MTKNVTISWDLPTVREDGSPLLASDILEVQVSIRVDNPTAPWTLVASISPASPQDFTAGDVDVGDWEYKLVVVDTEGRLGAAVITKFTVVSDAPPEIVTNVVITQA